MNYTFLLKKLDINGGARIKPLRIISMKIIEIYSKIFNTRESDQSITKAVYTFTTFYISIYDSSAKIVNDIIAAVTFKRDKNKRNAYIFWLGVR